MGGMPLSQRAMLLALATVVLTATSLAAGEFRGRRAVPTPSAPPPSASGGEIHSTTTARTVQVDPRIVRQAVEDIYATYTYDNARLRDLFDEVLHDRDRVLDNIATRIPRDAKLSVLGLEAIHTLEQREGRLPAKGGHYRESRVAVLVRGQIEFSDPVAGFVRRRGVSELILKVYERIP